MDSGRDGVAAGSDGGGRQGGQDDVKSVSDNPVEALGSQDRQRTGHGGTGVSTEHHQSRSGRMSVLGERHGGVRGKLTQAQSHDQGGGPPREGGEGGCDGTDGCADCEQQGQRRRLWQLTSTDSVRSDSESSRSGTDSCPPEGRGLLGCSHCLSQV